MASVHNKKWGSKSCKKPRDSKVININLNLNPQSVRSLKQPTRNPVKKTSCKNDHPPKYDDLFEGRSSSQHFKDRHHTQANATCSNGSTHSAPARSSTDRRHESGNACPTVSADKKHKTTASTTPQAVTIKLKPGQYKLDVQLSSKTRPFQIRLSPRNSTNSNSYREPEPLYYCDTPRQRASLPRRIQTFFRPSQDGHLHLPQQNKYNFSRGKVQASHYHPAHHVHPQNRASKAAGGQDQSCHGTHSSDTEDNDGRDERNGCNTGHSSTTEDDPPQNDEQHLSTFNDLEIDDDGDPVQKFDSVAFSVPNSNDSNVTTTQNTFDTFTTKLNSRTNSEEILSREESLLSAHKLSSNHRKSTNQRGIFRRSTHQERKRKYRLAERKKAEGNGSYKDKNYRDALQLYTEAINLCPDCAAYYSNRSACHMMLNKYTDALTDAREAVRLDPAFVKGYVRIAKCNIALGDANAAQSILRRAAELDPSNKSVQDEMSTAQQLLRSQEEIQKAASKSDYRTAIFHLDRALELALGCRHLKILKAEFLAYLQRYGDAQEIVNEIIQFDNGNVDALFVRGLCLYYQDNCGQAFVHFQHVLKLAPDHSKAKDVYKKAKLLRQKKDEGNQAFKTGKLSEALRLYSEALTIDPNNRNTRSKLFFNRATVRAKLGKLEEAVDDCTDAIILDESYIKAYLRRAKCYQEIDKHDEAVRDYDKVLKLDRSAEHKRLLHDAKLQQKKAKRKDYYKILGVTKTASDDEIKKSYRKMALQYHPDRHSSASEKEKKESEVKFKEVGEAYTVLADAKKRAMYDRGQDVNDPDGGSFFHEDIDPNQLFQTIFTNGGAFNWGEAPQEDQSGGYYEYHGGNFGGNGFHFQFG